MGVHRCQTGCGNRRQQDDNKEYRAADSSDEDTLTEMDEVTRRQFDEAQIDQEKLFDNGYVEADEDGNIAEEEFGDDDSDFDDSDDIW